MDQKKNIICTMDDVRGDFLGPPHGTTPAAVIANKNNYKILFNRFIKHCTRQVRFMAL